MPPEKIDNEYMTKKLLDLYNETLTTVVRIETILTSLENRLNDFKKEVNTKFEKQDNKKESSNNLLWVTVATTISTIFVILFQHFILK